MAPRSANRKWAAVAVAAGLATGASAARVDLLREHAPVGADAPRVRASPPPAARRPPPVPSSPPPPPPLAS